MAFHTSDFSENLASLTFLDSSCLVSPAAAPKHEVICASVLKLFVQGLALSYLLVQHTEPG